MANQTVATPRFYLDFTQLAKAKGYREYTTSYSENLSSDDDPKNLNVWDFDYAKTTNYTANTSGSSDLTFNCPPFWAEGEDVWDWSKLMSTVNFAGFINHNLYSSYGTQGDVVPKIIPQWFGDDEISIAETASPSFNCGGSSSLEADGYSIMHISPTAQFANIDQRARAGQFKMGIGVEGDLSSDVNFDIGAITFGKYIDMPHSPDLSVKKSVEYDGVKISRSLGGSDIVQVNHQGCPDWLVGEPWVLKPYGADNGVKGNGRIGRNGRRSWDLNFSYISNDDLFYDLRERTVGGASRQEGQNYDEGSVAPTNEIQLLWDLTLGGALSFMFCPDKDATFTYSDSDDFAEFAVCRLDQDSLVATQVAHQTWNISMRVVEVW